ncbi:hypothetical protein AGMMS49944_04240 [Spirochaetia bacterium]|nr:hypothetical protein AGMMS49944_04240 [Spirochaetia bacterium]
MVNAARRPDPAGLALDIGIYGFIEEIAAGKEDRQEEYRRRQVATEFIHMFNYAAYPRNSQEKIPKNFY